MHTDVVVVGGGPAGSVLALRLAQLGHSVTLVERAPFPRRQVGESLGPAIAGVLDLIGVRERVEAAGSLRPRTALIRWQGGRIEVKDIGEPGYQVDRGRFDQILLETAAQAGVRVLQPATASRPWRQSGGGWIVPLRGLDGERTLSSRYFVDACGRLSLLGGARARLSAPTLALYAYWRGVESEGSQTRIEAGEAEWFWGAPLPDKSFNATILLDPRRCAGHSRASVAELYRSLLTRFALARVCSRGTLSGGVKARDATSSVAGPLAGEDFLRVGEAAFTVDPLSSQGVHAAILTAVQAAAVINTTLRCPDRIQDAVGFYEDRTGRKARQFHRLSAEFYVPLAGRGAGPFWQRRASAASQGRAAPPEEPLPLGARLRLSADARLQRRPVLNGSLIEAESSLVHPRLEEPCAFINGIRLAPLLARLDEGHTGHEILRVWSDHLAPNLAASVLNWLWGIGAVARTG